MKINSLAFLTDLYFHRFTGIVLEYDDYLVVKTPTNPTFFWGNLLYFKNAPDADSLNNWQNIFHQQFKSMDIDHVTLTWDFKEGDEINGPLFSEEGFNLEKSIVLTAENVIRPQKLNNELIIRPIESEQDWQKVIDTHVLCRADHFNESSYRKYAERKISDYRLMIDKGIGIWVGAFYRDVLVGDLGLFYQNGLARFQAVETHPDFRRIGVCSTLLYRTCQYAKEYLNINKLVLVADPNYHAVKVYESVGFKIEEYQIGLCKYNQNNWVTT